MCGLCPIILSNFLIFDFYRSVDSEEEFDTNTSGVGDIEDSDQSIQNGTDTEYVFEQTNEGIERNGYGNGENVETDNEVIIISDGDGSDGGDDYFDANAPGVGDFGAYEGYMRRSRVIGPSIRNFERFTYEEYMGRISPVIDSPTQNIEQLTNLSTTTTAATTTTTTSTAANVATSPTMTQSIAPTALQPCCICLSDIVRGGIDLHNNMHHIHISCLVSLLNANNRIIWWGTSFGFHCPLCRKPVFGTFMLVT